MSQTRLGAPVLNAECCDPEDTPGAGPGRFPPGRKRRQLRSRPHPTPPPTQEPRSSNLLKHLQKVKLVVWAGDDRDPTGEEKPYCLGSPINERPSTPTFFRKPLWPPLTFYL